MKKIILALLLLFAATSVPAQVLHRGIALGADRDTLMYIVASPFDNWFVLLGGGVQTFIGNTPDPEAYWNKANVGARIEVGKWLIPDLAVSLRLRTFHANSKTIHAGNNPWIDYSSPITYPGVENIYYPMSVDGVSLLGIVTFDWTNFLSGYEAGKQKKWHFYTPVGLGGVWLYGKVINPNYLVKVNKDDITVNMGDVIKNKELAIIGGFMTEYFASQHISFSLAAEMMEARGSLDDHNYNLKNGKRRVDLMPSLFAGVKFNLFKSVTKYHPYDHTSTVEKVNHKFLAYGTRNTVRTLNERIAQLNSQIDSVQAHGGPDTLALANLNNERDSLQKILDLTQIKIDPYHTPINVMEELLDMNELLKLPSAIVYYQLDRYEIDYNGSKRLQRFAKEMKQLNDTLDFFIIGAADSATGSIPHNQWLSERRCEAAYNMLVNQYGADPKRLIMVPVGGITEYEPKENNRLALIILRSPVTEEIIHRWTKKRY